MSLDSLITKFQKEFGTANVMILDDVPKLDVISTGIPNLDLATGIGGWPRRLVTEVYGAEQLGKSVLAYKAIAEAQKMGLTAALITTEGIPDNKWAEVHGVDIKKVVILFAHNAEIMLEQAKSLSAEPEIDLLVIDSLAGPGTAKEIDADGKKQAYGISGIVAQMMHALLPNCWQTNKACLIMNQVRDKSVGQYIILDSPGGHSLHHGASIRVYLKKAPSPNEVQAHVNGVKKTIAKKVAAIVKKNKAGAPDHEAHYWIYFERPDDMAGFPGRGVDIVEPLIDVGVVKGVVDRKSAYYNIPGLKYEQVKAEGYGRDKLIDWLKEDYSRVDELYRLVKEVLYEDGQS